MSIRFVVLLFESPGFHGQRAIESATAGTLSSVWQQ
jgi:hypothetical protein